MLGLGIETAYAETISDDEGLWEWTLDTDTGELRISGTGIGWSGSEKYNSAPWYDERESIKKVSFAEGVSGKRLFGRMLLWLR